MNPETATLFAACIIFIVVSMWINRHTGREAWAKWLTFMAGMFVWVVAFYLIGYSFVTYFR